jgi:hypothetical protein
MFSKPAPVVEPEPAPEVGTRVPMPEAPVALVELSLSLDEPSVGWVAYLATKGVEIVEDDLGREAILRVDARQLFSEHRADEVRKAEHRARQEREAERADRLWRAQLPQGVSAAAIPPGLTFAEAAWSAELDSVGYRPRRTTMAEDLFDNSGTLTFHSLTGHAAGEE